VSALTFCSPDASEPHVSLGSPLARALGAGGGSVRAVDALRTLDVRGRLAAIRLEPGEELIQLAPDRAFLLAEQEAGPIVRRLREAGLRAYDLTAGFAALDVDGERLLRRLTDLDPAALPAAGAVLRTVTAVVQRRDGETFRLLVPQELAHSVAEAALDAAEALAS
jgi:sarcosine oxidase gamma subunit